MHKASNINKPDLSDPTHSHCVAQCVHISFNILKGTVCETKINTGNVALSSDIVFCKSFQTKCQVISDKSNIYTEHIRFTSGKT